nr:MAG TPA: hypothetical protein [Caudoviricetes sp.]
MYLKNKIIFYTSASHNIKNVYVKKKKYFTFV